MRFGNTNISLKYKSPNEYSFCSIDKSVFNYINYYGKNGLTTIFQTNLKRPQAQFMQYNSYCIIWVKPRLIKISVVSQQFPCGKCRRNSHVFNIRYQLSKVHFDFCIIIETFFQLILNYLVHPIDILSSSERFK